MRKKVFKGFALLNEWGQPWVASLGGFAPETIEREKERIVPVEIRIIPPKKK